MPCVAYLAFPLVARFPCGGRKGTFAYVVGQLSIAALGASPATIRTTRTSSRRCEQCSPD